MQARRATFSLLICVLVSSSGCASMQSALYKAVGIGGAEEREARRLAGRERAASLSEEEIDHRTAFLTERLDERRLHAQAWKYGWLTVNAGGGIAAATRAGFEDDGTEQANQIAQAGKAAIGVAYLLLNPMPGTSGADPVRALPAGSREDKLARLALAEELLARNAERAHDRTSWLLHFGNLFINAAAAAPAMAMGDSALAAESFGIGFAVGEAQIWTQPWEGPSDWEDYERFIATGSDKPATTSRPWRLMPAGTGVVLVKRF